MIRPVSGVPWFFRTIRASAQGLPALPVGDAEVLEIFELEGGHASAGATAARCFAGSRWSAPGASARR
jgi:hypothetical protein